MAVFVDSLVAVVSVEGVVCRRSVFVSSSCSLSKERPLAGGCAFGAAGGRGATFGWLCVCVLDVREERGVRGVLGTGFGLTGGPGFGFAGWATFGFEWDDLDLEDGVCQGLPQGIFSTEAGAFFCGPPFGASTGGGFCLFDGGAGGSLIFAGTVCRRLR